MPDGTVQEKTCAVCREGIDRQIEAVEGKIQDFKDDATERLNGHSHEIKDLTKVTIELAEMAKTQIESQKAISETLRILTNDVVELKVAVKEKKAAPAEQKPSQGVEFMKALNQAAWFNFAMKGVVVAALLILSVALGKSIGLDLTQILK